MIRSFLLSHLLILHACYFFYHLSTIFFATGQPLGIAPTLCETLFMNYARIRQAAIEKARMWFAQKPVFLDTETTGFYKTDEIVEICIVDHDGEVLLDSLVKPRRSIPIQASRVHGITDKMVQNAPTWREIWPKVQAILTGRKVGIYNASFDLRLIKQSHRENGMGWESIGASAFCIMKLYAQFHGERNGRGFRSQKLEKAGQQCGITLQNTHRAKADTLLARAVMKYMADFTIEEPGW